MILANHLVRTFSDGDHQAVQALKLNHFYLSSGENCAVTGPSGSGKSTFLHCLAGILRPTEGTVFVDDLCLSEMKEKEAAVWRASYVGYVFQKPLLLPFLTVMENILLSAELAGRKDSRTEAERFLSAVGLDQYGSKNPVHLSMGEQQRVSFVRAVIREPRLLLADEPTSSLDRDNSAVLMKLMLQYQKQSGCMLICATHDPAVQALFDHQFSMNRRKME
jgi:putative ABC transport system ATP-binding protein